MAYSRRGTTLSLHHPGGLPMDGGRIELPRASATLSSTPPRDDGSYSSVRTARTHRSASASWRSTRRPPSAPTWLDDVSPKAVLCDLRHIARPATSFVVAVEEEDGRSVAPRAPCRASPDAIGASLSSVDPGRHTARARPLVSARRRARPGPRALARRAARAGMSGLPEPASQIQTRFECRDLISPARLPSLWGMNIGRRLASCGPIGAVGDGVDASDGSRRPARMIVELLKIHQVLDYASLSTVSRGISSLDAGEFATRIRTLAALRAAEHARAQRWAEVRPAGRRRSASAAPRVPSACAPYLRARVAPRLERSTGDRRHRRRATKDEGILPARRFARGDAQPLRDDKDPCSPLGRAPCRNIGEADACLLRDDLPGARAAIDRRIVWQSGEVQSLARLAEVELRADRSAPDASARRLRLRDSSTRTGCRHATQGATSAGHELAGAADRRPRAARARAWLDRLGAPEAPSEASNPPIGENPPPSPRRPNGRSR
jgi:hypothetical protein